VETYERQPVGSIVEPKTLPKTSTTSSDIFY